MILLRTQWLLVISNPITGNLVMTDNNNLFINRLLNFVRAKLLFDSFIIEGNLFKIIQIFQINSMSVIYKKVKDQILTINNY